jgi:hypothetical protein
VRGGRHGASRASSAVDRAGGGATASAGATAPSAGPDPARARATGDGQGSGAGTGPGGHWGLERTDGAHGPALAGAVCPPGARRAGGCAAQRPAGPGHSGRAPSAGGGGGDPARHAGAGLRRLDLGAAGRLSGAADGRVPLGRRGAGAAEPAGLGLRAAQAHAQARAELHRCGGLAG